jgi:hypothetical protein
VIGLLAIAVVDRSTRLTDSGINVLSQGLVAIRYGQLEQEAEILSGSVVGFVLLAVAALLNTMVYPGWTRTLLFAGALCGAIAVSAWTMSRTKHAASAGLATLVAARGASVAQDAVRDTLGGAG